jgi:hypothetical protein
MLTHCNDLCPMCRLVELAAGATDANGNLRTTNAGVVTDITNSDWCQRLTAAIQEQPALISFNHSSHGLDADGSLKGEIQMANHIHKDS